MKFPIACFLIFAMLAAGGCAMTGPETPQEPLPELLIIQQPVGWNPGDLVPPAAIPIGEPAGLQWTLKDGSTRQIDADWTHISVTIAEFLATTSTRQHFDAAKIPAAAAEGSYELLLPRESVMRDFVLTVGDRQMRAVVREATQAQRIYDLAKQHGLTVAMVSAGMDGLRIQLGHLHPAGPMDVTLQYVQSLVYADGWFEYLLPISGHEGNLQLSADVDAGAPLGKIESSTHDIVPTMNKDGTAHITVTNPNSHDFILRYSLASGAPQAILMHGPKSTTPADPDYFSLMLVPGRGGEMDDLHITWQGKTPDLVGVLPATLDNQPIVIAGQGYTGVVISGIWNGKPLQLNVTQSPSADVADVAWAMLKLADEERAFEATQDPALVQQMKQTALDFSMVTPFTSLLLVDAAKPERNP